MAKNNYSSSRQTYKTSKNSFKRAKIVRRRPSFAPLVIAFAISVVGATSLSLSSAAPEFAQWNVICSSSHFKADDPIVYPGQPGKSHMHSFFANRSTNANTTAASLLATSPSTCGRNMGSKDLSAYWVPAMYKRNADGSSTMLGSNNQRMTIYYRRVGSSSGPLVKPFPHGLRMVAGSAVATSPQPHTVVYWQCGGGGPEFDTIPTCSNPNEPVRADIMFPSCWDGKNLDSANHRSHMAYPATSGTCPASHPVSLPQINFEVWYDGVAGGSSYYLASGGPYTLHGDFFAAWDNQTQNALIAKCMNSTHDCAGIHLSDDGRSLFVPDYDPAPISIVLGAYSTASPWDGSSLQTPAPQQTVSTPTSSNSHTAHTPTSGQSSARLSTGTTDVTPSSANLTATEVQTQAAAVESVTPPESKYATSAGSYAESARSVWLQKLGYALIAGGIVFGFGIWLTYTYITRRNSARR